MAELFGDLERLAADLYPYRWPVLAGFLIVAAAATVYGFRRSWHMWLWRRRLPVAIIGVPLLALLGFIGYYLGSPLFTNVTVNEELPFAFTASIDGQAAPSAAATAAPADATPVPAFATPTRQGPAAASTPPPSPTSASQSAAASTPEPASTAAPSPVATQAPPAVPTPGAGTTPAAAPQPTSTATPAPSPTPIPAPTATPTPTPSPTPATIGAVKLKVGEFKDQDSFHRGSGTATIYRGPDGSLLLRLEDLDVTNGPDLHVILSPHQDPNSPSDVFTAGYVNLGKLKGNRGNQNYPIPAEVDVSAQGSVVIYCSPFDVIFSVATLQDAG